MCMPSGDGGAAPSLPRIRGVGSGFETHQLVEEGERHGTGLGVPVLGEDQLRLAGDLLLVFLGIGIVFGP